GMNAPLLLHFITSELIARADVSVMAHHRLHAGIAMAALVLSIEEGTTRFDTERGRVIETRFREAIDEIVAGEAWGCVDIAEPGAGSDMSALRTVGEADEHGNWFVSGEKTFTPSGHGKWHFVLARTESVDASKDSGASSSLSLFLVPTYYDDVSGERIRVVQIRRAESAPRFATCVLAFNRAPAMLVGERGAGFKHLLALMNGAHVAFGFECLGLCEAAYRRARQDTQGRTSTGKPLDRHELIADHLDEMEADIVSLRAMAMKAAYHEELAQKLALRLRQSEKCSDEERKSLERALVEHRAAARRITPLLAYCAAHKAMELSRRSAQIRGDNGYIIDAGAEKLRRDALTLPVYDGASHVHALAAMRDTLGGVTNHPQEFVRALAQARWRQVSARDPLEKRVGRLQYLSLS
ncbi:MAG: acyl-CoA dehydrogenase family protein, partial [Polyangiaceae bacterium]|nr:acyl-CoA dehydrogenase family protein [Polyangiaceae bacterium]